MRDRRAGFEAKRPFIVNRCIDTLAWPPSQFQAVGAVFGVDPAIVRLNGQSFNWLQCQAKLQPLCPCLRHIVISAKTSIDANSGERRRAGNEHDLVRCVAVKPGCTNFDGPIQKSVSDACIPTLRRFGSQCSVAEIAEQLEQRRRFEPFTITATQRRRAAIGAENAIGCKGRFAAECVMIVVARACR